MGDARSNATEFNCRSGVSVCVACLCVSLCVSEIGSHRPRLDRLSTRTATAHLPAKMPVSLASPTTAARDRL